MTDRKKVLLGAALTGMLAASAGSVAAEAHMPAKEGSVQCYGVNSCKGQGECGGKGHGCAGQNECKGKGWVSLTKADCDAKGGTYDGQAKKK